MVPQAIHKSHWYSNTINTLRWIVQLIIWIIKLSLWWEKFSGVYWRAIGESHIQEQLNFIVIRLNYHTVWLIQPSWNHLLANLKDCIWCLFSMPAVSFHVQVTFFNLYRLAIRIVWPGWQVQWTCHVNANVHPELFIFKSVDDYSFFH